MATLNLCLYHRGYTATTVALLDVSLRCATALFRQQIWKWFEHLMVNSIFPDVCYFHFEKNDRHVLIAHILFWSSSVNSLPTEKFYFQLAIFTCWTRISMNQSTTVSCCVSQWPLELYRVATPMSDRSNGRGQTKSNHWPWVTIRVGRGRDSDGWWVPWYAPMSIMGSWPFVANTSHGICYSVD